MAAYPPDTLDASSPSLSTFDGVGPLWHCWACGTAKHVTRAGGGTLAVTFGFDMPMKRVRTSLRSYGHIWAHVEALYRCLLYDRDSTARPARVLLPQTYRGGRQPEAALVELEVLLNGRGLKVQRTEAVPICMPTQGCCVTDVNASVRLSVPVAQLRVPFASSAGPIVLSSTQALPRPPPWRLALRSTVWRNLEIEAVIPDTVLFCLAGKQPTNGRKIQNEEEIVEQLRAHFALHHRRLRFISQQLDQLDYADEIRLVRRSRVLISLFGSGLHNCRFLDKIAIVVEIHGALKNDIGVSDWHLYARLCAQEMGLRWVGHAATAHKEHASLSKLHLSRRQAKTSPYFLAYVNGTKLLAVVCAAMRGQWRSAMEQYVMDATVGAPDETPDHRLISSGLHGLLRLQQYAQRNNRVQGRGYTT